MYIRKKLGARSEKLEFKVDKDMKIENSLNHLWEGHYPAIFSNVFFLSTHSSLLKKTFRLKD
jgi:hypothetical protein